MKFKSRTRGFRGILEGALALITRNWGLKLLALVLAVVIYYILEPRTSSESHKLSTIIVNHDRPDATQSK